MLSITDTLADKRISPVLKPNFRQRRPRKTGLTTIDFQKKFPELREEKQPTEETCPVSRPAGYVKYWCIVVSWLQLQHFTMADSDLIIIIHCLTNCLFAVGRRKSRKAELLAKQQTTKKAAATRHGENVMVERCSECNAVLEQYDDDTIGLCITNLATFVHREPGLATPKLLDMLQCAARSGTPSLFDIVTHCYLSFIVIEAKICISILTL